MSAGRTLTGQLAQNVMHFARVLRSAGMSVGTDRVQVALAALQQAGLERRQDFHAVLQCCLLDRIEHRELFDQAFALFWHDAERTHAMRIAAPPAEPAREADPAPRHDLRPGHAPVPGGPPPGQPAAPDAPSAGTDRERLQKADFDTMTDDEWHAARRLLHELPLLTEELPTRRQAASARPVRVDWRATMAQMARQGGELAALRWRAPRTRPASLAVLADISGSMSRYSRMLLHFAHGLAQAQRRGGARVESFVFGTRLTRTTRLLRSRDPDIAVAQVVRAVQDWSGGTRITTSLHEFNQRWARRVLDSRTTVLLITDGLEHGDTRALGFEAERLRKSCSRVVWLNPLLRFDRFEPRAGGIKAMLPHVDRFLPAHNLDSLAALVRVLRAPADAPRPAT